MLIADLLKQNARLYPDEIALIELRPGKNVRKTITWREFDEKANRVANALTARGIKKDDKVIHLMMNSIDWLAVYFGIIRKGAWAVPLNFRFTGAEIKYCADIAEARIMILSEEFTERVVPIARSSCRPSKNYIFAGQKLPEGMEALGRCYTGGITEAAENQINSRKISAGYILLPAPPATRNRLF